MDLSNIPIVAFIKTVNGGPQISVIPITPVTPVQPVDPIKPIQPIIPIIEVSEAENIAEEYADNFLLFEDNLFDD